MRSPLMSRHLAVPLAIAAAGGALATPAAHAGSFEQISRASGAQGWSPTLSIMQPVWTGDSGRLAVFQYSALGAPGGPVPSTYYVRDIVANTSRVLGADLVAVFGVDRTERYALAQRYKNGTTSLVMLPLAGGAERVVWSYSKPIGVISAALSGDGTTIAASVDGWGVYKIAVATGAVQQLDTASPELGPRSISDDGQVVAGGTLNPFGGVYYRGTSKTTTKDRVIVSPNGAVVASIGNDGGWKVVTKRLADGVVQTFPAPNETFDLAWISTDGRTLATPSYPNASPAVPAQVLDTRTGAWSSLGGPYNAAISGELAGLNFNGDAPSVSRSGRYATALLGSFVFGQLALVDLTDGDLPGAQEPLSASAYVSATNPVVRCGTDADGTTTISFKQPRPWVPRPQRAQVRVLADGQEVLDATLTNAAAPGETGDTRTVSFPPTTKSLTFAFSVVDASGTTVSSTETAKPTNAGGCL